ncbi:type II secretion system protein [Candidatus Nitrospira neomarina]|uniref:Prepilin-type N-terminal cleavage/methylation domain-containing protein n=1 Tax=Candidatus Nitrospira neomarina TaxID=3020899 RepID=A0AA96K389_9BACT|nr:prepilin-type N-terminal cleavage/methylation domain-containing protein [Candidatus Nitrospira neomarina]WNM62354.1 prepilin-type N-terminal cleavage/methylation domain-containing protein [Candidatus Nitrospira neomarina]
MKQANAGFSLIGVLVVLAIIFVIFAAIETYSLTGGATPETLTIDGPETLVDGQTGVYTLTVDLDGKPETPREFTIRIDEDDFFDDTLDELLVKVNVADDTESVPFDLTCKDLTVSRRSFNLVGDKGTSNNEATHGVHAEYGRGTLFFDLTSKENFDIDCVLTEEELESGSNEGNQ